MAISVVQTATLQTTTAGTTLTATFSAAGAGSLLCAFFNTTSATDTITTPTGWTLGPTISVTGASHKSYVYYKTAAGGETSVTVAWSTSGRGELGAVEVSGIPSPVLDVHAETDGGGSNVSMLAATATGATTAAAAIAFAWFGLNAGAGGTYAFTNGYTAGYTASADAALGVKILSSISAGETTTATWTTARRPSAQMLVFKSAAVNATVTPSAVAVVVTIPAVTVTHVADANVASLLDAFTKAPTAGSGISYGPDADAHERFVVQAFEPWQDDVLVWDAFDWDAEPWAGPGRWHDITRWQSIEGNAGANDPVSDIGPASGTLTLDNRDGQASPWARISSGEFTIPTVDEVLGGLALSWLQPGCIVRWGVLSGDGWFPRFTGVVEKIDESAALSESPYVTLTCVDTSTWLANYVGSAQTPIGAGDSLSDRVARLLSDASWQAPYDVAGDPIGDIASFQATTLEGSRWQELQLVAKSVGMRVLIGGDGGVAFTNAQPGPDVFGPADIVFTNDLNIATNIFDVSIYVPLVDVTPYASTDRIINIASAARVDGTAQTFQLQESVAEFGPFAVNIDGLLVDDDDIVAQVVTQKVLLHAFDSRGVSAITLDVNQDDVNLPGLVATYGSTGLTTRIPFNLQWLHWTSGETYVATLLVDGFAYSVKPGNGRVLEQFTLNVSTRHTYAPDANWSEFFWDDGTVWGFVS